jgi:hypothetical protein
MTTPNYRLLASQRFIGITVNGTGRFAILSCDRKSCWLVADERTAQGAALGSCHMVTPCRCEHEILDLSRSCPEAPRCKDRDYSDRAERRKYGA